MMRIFVIGNSHTACLKKGWENVRHEFPGIEMRFFAHRGKKIADLEVQGRLLVPANRSLEEALVFTSGGYRHIDPEAADRIFLYGMGLKIPADRGLFYSQQVQTQAYRDHVVRSRSWALLRKIRTVSDIPVLVGHDPLPAGEPEGTMTVNDYFRRVAVIDDLGFRELEARLIRQPEETLADGSHTKSFYTSQSTRLSVGKDNDDELHPTHDIYHMNDRFGEIVLRDFFEQIAVPEIRDLRQSSEP